MACSLFFAAGLQAVETPTDPRLNEKPTPQFTADQILNGECPGRKASPAVAEEFDADGFAKERLYHVPKPGIHPRILFGPEDLPRIRKQLHDSKAGRRILATLKEKVADGLEKPGTWENDCYVALLAGDAVKYKTVLYGVKTPLKPGPPAATGNPIVNGLLYKLILATVEDEPKVGKDLAKAITTFATELEGEVDDANKEPFSDDYWRVIRHHFSMEANIGFLYDLGVPYMKPEQSAVLHRVLVKATKGKYTLGMDLPHHWRNWNFIGMAEYFPLIALALEGEDGYDARIFARGGEVAHDYINYSMTPQGIAKEAIGYHTAGVGHLTTLMLAMANRGDYLLTNTRYRQMLENWAVWAMQPWGGLWASSGDLGTFPPNYVAVQAMAYFYPHSPSIDYILQNHPIVRSEKEKLDMMSVMLAIVTPADPKKQKDGEVVNYHFGKDLGFPNSLFDPERGYSFARTGWDKDAATFQFVCRNDTRFPSHDFPDRGTFFFSANGRAWSVSGMRENESKYLNTITIDGRGQGYFPTPGKWLERVDKPEAVFNSVDLSYCYNWRWSKNAFLMSDAELAAKPWLTGYADARDRMLKRIPLNQWERDPSPAVVDYYSGFLAGDPGMWDEDSWVMRAPHLPVKKAFRTAGLVRGAHPYAVVVDDIQKDDQEHLYEWRMSMPNDVELVDANGGDLILGPVSAKRSPKVNFSSAYKDIAKAMPEKGTPQLLVHIVNVNQPDIPTYQPNPCLESVEFVKHDDMHQFTGRSLGLGKRLVIPSRSASPDYKILLIPFREGDELPKFEWDKSKEHLEVKWKDQTDSYQFTQGTDGRTLFKLLRGDKAVAEVGGAPQAQ